jgi:hypothetical protein
MFNVIESKKDASLTSERVVELLSWVPMLLFQEMQAFEDSSMVAGATATKVYNYAQKLHRSSRCWYQNPLFYRTPCNATLTTF